MCNVPVHSHPYNTNTINKGERILKSIREAGDDVTAVCLIGFLLTCDPDIVT